MKYGLIQIIKSSQDEIKAIMLHNMVRYKNMFGYSYKKYNLCIHSFQGLLQYKEHVQV